MLSKKAKKQAESALTLYKGKYANRIRLDKTFGKLVTYSPNKRDGIYNWFHYKEAFSRGLVIKLIEMFDLKLGDYVLDPFCGIGTTLLAAKEKSINSIGIDIVPLCTFISEVKMNVCDYSPKKIQQYLRKIIHSNLSIDETITIPNISIIKKAFNSEKDFLKILSLKQLIKKVINSPTYQKLFILGLLSTVGELSNTKKDGAFLRIVKKNKSNSDERIKRLFSHKIEKYIFDLNTLNSKLFESNLCKSKIYNEIQCGDARDIKLKRKFHAVITSPPYLNRYDYVRIYALELAVNFVKNFDELKEIRYQTIRSHVEAKYRRTKNVQSSELKKCLAKLERRKLNNPRILEMIEGYFEDMYLVLKRLKKYSRKDAKIAFVVGTVRYSGINIPVDVILAEIGEQLGLKLKEIIVARIKGNSQQQRKKYGESPTRESIVILNA